MGRRITTPPRRQTRIEVRLVPRKAKPFWSHVNFWGPQTELVPTRCWVWTGSDSGSHGHRKPYGQHWDSAQHRSTKAHRYLWEHVHGPLATGLVIDHLCRTTLCVRPSHLEPVTVRENNMRGNAPAYITSRTNRCARDHDLEDPANAYRRPDGGRICRACHRESKRRYKQRQRKNRTAA